MTFLLCRCLRLRMTLATFVLGVEATSHFFYEYSSHFCPSRGAGDTQSHVGSTCRIIKRHTSQ